MMQPLRDLLDSEDPAVAELAQLVRAVGDLDPPRGAQYRVRDALAECEQSRPSWRKLALATLLLVIALPVAIAGASKLIQAWAPAPAPMQDQPAHRRVLTAASFLSRHVPTAPKLVPAMPPASVLPVPEEPILPPARSLAMPATLPIDPSSAEHNAWQPARHEPPSARDLVAAPTAAPADSSLTPPRESPHPEPSTPAQASPEIAPASPEEAALVLGALRALRRDRDVQAAIRQLERYRLRFPAGDLAEEALALTIEAFAALDDRAALTFADEYLRRFPQGRFREDARRAQQRLKGPR